ncbi:hypothetical protein N4G70_34525 [Streptomyces sp. ASQP_92]|uniref:hypothetical protein n=1 Tax=Streptomyces sp. ASQP_92 TaxID=2979116 RepID=UPI0021C1CBF7|nr:hypothetical protein [Streptomyces sp. ASQP_92]MCT9093936.1 hypothetical protein [Streptomyces sp. ASQP_92]
MTAINSHPDTGRMPGRTWTIRLAGHADHTATLTCSSAACRMPPRSPDLARLRAYAAAHAAAHARAAGARPHAACACRAQDCAAHEAHPVSCAGQTVLILRHDPSIGQVWSLSEVCAACAARTPHTQILARTAPIGTDPAAPAQRPVRPPVAGGFSAPAGPGGPAPEAGIRRAPKARQYRKARRQT